jgi:2-dehydro-3-deoxyphosphooctonate aldolase (KDO 8-P synthase)
MEDYKDKFIFIAGPCVIENERLTIDIASYLKELVGAYPIFFIFKASFDKANRTSLKSFRGPGPSQGIRILEKVKKKLDIPILSDIHCRHQIKYIKDIIDIIQIPAFLCRQTDLIIEAAKTKKVVNIKKGQFLSPYDVKYIIEKIESTGNKNIFLTERGTSFGYNNLVVDFRSFLIMQAFGYPVIYDATHSLQKPSAEKGISGGDRQFIAPMTLGAVASGVNGIFMEVHPKPKRALSDRNTVYPLTLVGGLLKKIIKVREAVYGQI